MKKMSYYGILLLAVLNISHPGSLHAQEGSYYTLGVQNVAPAKITFTNNSNLEVKVILYKDNDNTMKIGLTSFNIKPGKSHSYKTGVYNVKIFKPQFLDKHLETKKNVSGNLRMSGTEKKFSAVRLSARENTVFKNNTKEKIKICLYKSSDVMKTIPIACYELKDNTSTASYSGDEKSFFVSVFVPGLIDRLLVSQICPDQSVITVNKSN
ncbi:MAG: hypothetical protein JNK14_12780 [Chitinophagaceae bacterium]|nr:hypothetical protein [Chitinophagaceae bacterium]